MQVALTNRDAFWRGLPAPRIRTIVAMGAISALLLSACSGGAPTTTSGQESASRVPAAQGRTQFDLAQSDKAASGAVAGGAGATKSGTPVVGLGPKLTRSASLQVQVGNVSSAAARVRTIAAGLQALILSEQIGKGGPGGPGPVQDATAPDGGFGTMTLSVPADKLDTAMDQLAKIGTVMQRTTSSQDVTSQYLDTQSRLKTMRASVARVRTLMAQAKDLGQVVALEGELSRREADLESLESQLAALNTSVERSTLAVSLNTPGNEPVKTNSFLAGLRSGWDAFTSSASALFTGIGALLPFAVLLALLGIPAWSWWRRRNQPASATAVNA
ncbi:MAG: DUF4349 domain-containing protein [Dermatophilaceae bacterium]